MAAPRDSLLPGNATARETAHAETDGRLDDIDMDVIRRAKDPATAPAEMLPALAWEWSADVWDPSWPVDIKRRIVAASPEVHRLKGTRRAVQVALDALHIKATIKEWWQKAPQGQPYTFHVRAFASARFTPGAPVLSEALTRQALAAVTAAKPVSRSFTFDIAVAFEGRLGAGAWGAGAMVAGPKASAAPVTMLGRRLGIAAAKRAALVAVASGAAGPSRQLGRKVGIVSAVTALNLVSVRVEARVS